MSDIVFNEMPCRKNDISICFSPHAIGVFKSIFPHKKSPSKRSENNRFFKEILFNYYF